MRRLACILATLLLTAGCATVPEDARVDYDPLEGLNRGIYGINDALDRVLTKPIARGYQKIVPEPARKCVKLTQPTNLQSVRCAYRERYPV